MSKILSKTITTCNYTLECTLLPYNPELARDERSLVFTLTNVDKGEQKSTVTSIVDITVKSAIERHKDIAIKLNYCKSGVEVVYESNVLNNNFADDYLFIFTKVRLNHISNDSEHELGNTELLFIIPNPYQGCDVREKSIMETLLDHARLVRLKDTYLDSDATLVEKHEFIKVLESSIHIMDRIFTMTDSELYTTDDNIRKTREKRRLEGLFIPNETYCQDCMGSGWLSRPDDDIDFQKWENSGRVAIHAIKLG